MIQMILVPFMGALIVGFLLSVGVHPWRWQLPGHFDTSEQSAVSSSFDSRSVHLSAQRVAPPGISLGRAEQEPLARRREGVETLRMRGDFPITKDMLDGRPRSVRHTHCEPACFDSGEIFMPVKLDGLSPEYWAVGWKPVVKKFQCPDGSMVEWVHHINVMRIAQNHTFEQKVYMRDEFDEFRRSAGGMFFVASYDRGAGEYWLPEGYGVPFDGTHLAMVFHVLKPKCWDWSIQAAEFSGFDLYFTRKPPGMPARFMAWADARMRIQRRPGAVHYVSELPPRVQQKIFDPAFSRGFDETITSRPRLLAVHLHTHGEFDTKYFELYHPNGTLSFRSREEPCGYGLVEQSMENIALQRAINPQDESKMDWPVIELEPGQLMRQHCMKKDMGSFEDSELVFGLSWGEEMCAPLTIIGGPGLDIRGNAILSMNSGYQVPLRRGNSVTLP